MLKERIENYIVRVLERLDRLINERKEVEK